MYGYVALLRMTALKHARRTFLSNKRAVSGIIVAVIFITTAVTMGVVYFSWAEGVWGRSVVAGDQFLQRRSDNLKEYVVIESVWINNLNNTKPGQNYVQANLTVRNVGTTPVTVVAVYVDGILALSPNSNIAVGQTAIFTNISVRNTSHSFKVVTSKGSSASVVWAPG